MIDLTPACRRTIDVLAKVNDDQMTDPTPCAKIRLDELVAHVGGLSLAFTAAARKEFGPLTDTPPTDGAQLDDDWRTAYPQRLTELALAWQNPAAWAGHDPRGRLRLPRRSGGLVALTEVVIHGWDIARATGQDYAVDPATGRGAAPRHPDCRRGSGRGIVRAGGPIADDAPVLDRVDRVERT